MVGMEPFGFATAIRKAKNFTKNMPNGIETGLDATAEVMRVKVVEFAPQSTKGTFIGTYRDSIKTVFADKGIRLVGSDKFVTSLSSGRTWNLGAILEFGVSHEWIIRPILAQVLFGNGIFYGQEVTHPPMPPQPHFAPAIPEVRQIFPNLFNKTLVDLWIE